MLGEPFIKVAAAPKIMFRMCVLLIETNQVDEVACLAREKRNGTAAPGSEMMLVEVLVMNEVEHSILLAIKEGTYLGVGTLAASIGGWRRACARCVAGRA